MSQTKKYAQYLGAVLFSALLFTAPTAPANAGGFNAPSDELDISEEPLGEILSNRSLRPRVCTFTCNIAGPSPDRSGYWDVKTNDWLIDSNGNGSGNTGMWYPNPTENRNASVLTQRACKAITRNFCLNYGRYRCDIIRLRSGTALLKPITTRCR